MNKIKNRLEEMIHKILASQIRSTKAIKIKAINLFP